MSNELSTKVLYQSLRHKYTLKYCLRVLGFPPALEPDNHRTFKTAISQMDTYDLNELVEHLYRESSKKYYPDFHTENKEFYTEKMKEINVAHHRVKYLINLHKREGYVDAMNYATRY